MVLFDPVVLEHRPTPRLLLNMCKAGSPPILYWPASNAAALPVPLMLKLEEGCWLAEF
jgi:hypothetical protein